VTFAKVDLWKVPQATHTTCRPSVTRVLPEGYGSKANGFDLVWEGWARWRNVNCYSHSQRGVVVLRSNLRLTLNLCWHTVCARVSGGVVFCMTQSQFPVCLRLPYVAWLWRNCQGGWGRQHNLQIHTVFCGLSQALTWVNIRCGDRVQTTKWAKWRAADQTRNMKALWRLFVQLVHMPLNDRLNIRLQNFSFTRVYCNFADKRRSLGRYSSLAD
jgi:hypothetical protein